MLKFSTFLYLFLCIITSLQKFGMGFLKAVCPYCVLISVELHWIAFEILEIMKMTNLLKFSCLFFFFFYLSLILKEILSYVSSKDKHDYTVWKETFVLLLFLFFLFFIF